MAAGPGSFDGPGVWAVLGGERGVLEPAIEGLVVRLCRSNRAQWEAEDRARAAGEPYAVAQAKDEIDRLNAGRGELVHQLDVRLNDLLSPSSLAPLCTETPGSVCDRLSIFAIRLSFASAAGLTERAAQIGAQASELCGALDVLLADVRAGHRGFTVHGPNKLYGLSGRARGRRASRA